MREDGFVPKKSLGQHFLVNTAVRDRIITACELEKDDIVLEIGPGKGALTSEIAARAGEVFAVEKDDRLARALEERFAGSNVRVIHADILEYPFEELPSRLKLIGNLPYNIATPILEKILRHRHKFSLCYITVQLEYGARLCARPHTKDYGSLSCFLQYYADAACLFKIKDTAFRPVPKVQSCFMRLEILPRPRRQASDEEALFRVIRTCFQQRRKTIVNALAPIFQRERIRELLEKCQIDPRARPEDLSLEEYIRLIEGMG